MVKLEVIKELAFKASGGMLYYDGEDEWRLSQKEAEKFAELIVRECAEVAEDWDGAHYVGTAIKQHFGIEA